MHEEIKPEYNLEVEPIELFIQAFLSVGCLERAPSDYEGHNDQ